MRAFALLPLLLVACGGSTQPEPVADSGPADAPADGDAVVETGDCPIDTPEKPGVVQTDRGAVAGSLAGKTWSYRKIPFAAPPVGPLRYAPPAAAPCWSGPRDATQWGKACPQLSTDGTGPFVGEEDCLQLNVWTPEAATRTSALPVMVWIHGGGHQLGSAVQEASGIRIYDAQSLAERGNVVVVSINYRLGALGFLAHKSLTAASPDKSSGMYGHLDQVAALRWVQKNAGAFGGDPNKVTIFGESAGGVSVCALIASPLAKGLFGAAIIQSGGCPGKKLADAETFGAKVFDANKCEGSADPVACMRAVPVEKLVAALPTRVDVAGTGAGYSTVIEGHAMPSAPLELIGAGKHNAVPVIFGTNSDETSRTVPLKPTATDAEYQAAVRLLLPTLADKILAVYPSSDYASPFAAYVAVTSDAKFVCPWRVATKTFAKGQTQPIFRYQLSHTLDNAPLLKPFGAWHGVDVLYIFDHVAIAGYVPSAGERGIVGTFQTSWTDFAKTGLPGAAWQKWDVTDPYFKIDTTTSVEKGLRTKQCDFWEPIYTTL